MQYHNDDILNGMHMQQTSFPKYKGNPEQQQQDGFEQKTRLKASEQAYTLQRTDVFWRFAKAKPIKS